MSIVAARKMPVGAVLETGKHVYRVTKNDAGGVTMTCISHPNESGVHLQPETVVQEKGFTGKFRLDIV